MKQYQELASRVINLGEVKGDRTGTGTISRFGDQIRFHLADGFPLVTTKTVNFRAVVHELLWMIAGKTSLEYLHNNNVHIWDEWADKYGNLGPIYGEQWRSWKTHNAMSAGGDQLGDVIQEIKENPNSRRLIVSSWNVADLEYMRLPPCHVMFQFYVNYGTLSCHMYQRSADLFLGVPFNIASYALLTHMIAQMTDLTPGELIISFGDVHIYTNHMAQISEQLSRSPRPLPQIFLAERERIDDFRYEDVSLLNYNPHPAIRGEISV